MLIINMQDFCQVIFIIKRLFIIEIGFLAFRQRLMCPAEALSQSGGRTKVTLYTDNRCPGILRVQFIVFVVLPFGVLP